MAQKTNANMDVAGGSGDGQVHPRTGRAKKMDLELLIHYLTLCISEDSSINLEYYTKMYREINRFFELLGSIFNFVSKDVLAKVQILEEYQKSSQASSYITVQSMVQFETENDLLRKTTEPLSGSRTLLRLHRALEFIIEFLDKVNSANDDDGTGTYAQNAYNETLANYHPWIIRKAAIVAMYALPYKQQLMLQTCDVKNERLNHLVNQVVTKAREVYNSVQSVYETNNILELP